MRQTPLFYWPAADEPAQRPTPATRATRGLARPLLFDQQWPPERLTRAHSMPRAKIFYLISSLAQGGAERHLVELVRRLDPDRFASDICVLADHEHFRCDVPQDQPRYRLRSRVWASPPALARLVAALRVARPQILHTYLNDGNLWGRLAASFTGPRPRIITSVHLDDMSAGYRWVERRLAGRSDCIIAHSRSVERLLVDRLGIARERVVVIANGVDPARFFPATPDAKGAARAAHGVDRDDFVALMAARIAPQKNQDLVVEALARLKAAGALPARFRLLLAGRVSSRAYDRRVRAAVARADLGDHVRFLGPVSDMPSLYAAADVVLMPSQTEASPIAALEALACGVPVLLSAAANTDGVLVDGQHGWQIGEVSVASIAASIEEIARTSVDVRARLGAAARAHVVEHFTTARMAAEFMRRYDAVMAPRQAA
jgi:glycosyltransferase involved in cell wall biosynthesis